MHIKKGEKKNLVIIIEDPSASPSSWYDSIKYH